MAPTTPSPLSTVTPSPLAWERAFALARAHGHLWAHAIDDAVLAAWAAYPSYDDVCVRPELGFDAQLAFEAAVNALRERGDGRAPRSEEEARVALSAALVDCSCPWGVEPALSHTTGTGRLSWTVDALGEVVLTVSRPTVAVAIQVSVGVTGGVLVHRAHAGVFAWRHVEALHCALRALNAELPLIVALNADDDWEVLAQQYERSAEDSLDAADQCDPERWPDEERARQRYLHAESWYRARAEAFRAWARLRRPVIRGGTSADYAAAQERMWSAQRSLLNTLLGSAT